MFQFVAPSRINRDRGSQDLVEQLSNRLGKEWRAISPVTRSSPARRPESLAQDGPFLVQSHAITMRLCVSDAASGLEEERIMTVPSLLEEPGRVDEPQAAQEYAAVLSQVVAAGRPVIVRRNGEDLAAVVPLEHLELVREILAHQEVEDRRRRSIGPGHARPPVRRNRGSTTRTTTPSSRRRNQRREPGPPAAARQRRLGGAGRCTRLRVLQPARLLRALRSCRRHTEVF